jgi:hypothetical protein
VDAVWPHSRWDALLLALAGLALGCECGDGQEAEPACVALTTGVASGPATGRAYATRVSMGLPLVPELPPVEPRPVMDETRWAPVLPSTLPEDWEWDDTGAPSLDE